MVYHASLSWDFAPTPSNLNLLADQLDAQLEFEVEVSSRPLAISYHLGTNVEFHPLDLSGRESVAWPFRTAAMAMCLATATADETPQDLLARVEGAELDLRARVAASLREFTEALDAEIRRLPLAGLSCRTYNYLNGGNAVVRRNRLQLAKAMPSLLLAGVANASNSDSLRQLQRAVDSSESLTKAIENVCGVRSVTARHAMKLPAQHVNADDLVIAIRLLDVLSPDHFPKDLSEWETFMQLSFKLIPAMTGLPRTAPASRALLKAASIQGWSRAKIALQSLNLDRATILLFSALLAAYRRAISYEIIHGSSIGEFSAEVRAGRIADEIVRRVGLTKFIEAAGLYPRLLRESHSALSHEHQLKRGLAWETALVEPVVAGECIFLQIADSESLGRLANKLANCLTDYRFECSSGQMLAFSISTHDGRLLGALSVKTLLCASGKCSVWIDGSAGPKNAPLATSHQKAVEVFFASLLSADVASKIAPVAMRQRARYQDRGRSLEKHMAIEASIAALNQLPQRSMRFSALMNRR